MLSTPPLQHPPQFGAQTAVQQDRTRVSVAFEAVKLCRANRDWTDAVVAGSIDAVWTVASIGRMPRDVSMLPELGIQELEFFHVRH